MAGIIDWNKVPRNGKVIEKGGGYVYNGKRVVWSSFDAYEAQMYLSSLVKKKKGATVYGMDMPF